MSKKKAKKPKAPKGELVKDKNDKPIKIEREKGRFYFLDCEGHLRSTEMQQYRHKKK